MTIPSCGCEAALALADAASDVIATWADGDLDAAVRLLDDALQAFNRASTVTGAGSSASDAASKSGPPWRGDPPDPVARFQEALFIIQPGACNPSGIAHAIIAACRQARAEGHVPAKDPAVRLMVTQLAWVCQADSDTEAYGELIAACKRRIAEVSLPRQTIPWVRVRLKRPGPLRPAPAIGAGPCQRQPSIRGRDASLARGGVRSMNDASPAENEKPAPAEQIRALNDAFRRSFVGGRVLITRGVQALGPERVATLLARVKAFDQFTEDNDPHLEHDFGAFDDEGERFFWKIDYYDLTLTWHSPNPADPLLTCRVLTLMLAEEY